NAVCPAPPVSKSVPSISRRQMCMEGLGIGGDWFNPEPTATVGFLRRRLGTQRRHHQVTAQRGSSQTTSKLVTSLTAKVSERARLPALDSQHSTLNVS